MENQANATEGAKKLVERGRKPNQCICGCGRQVTGRFAQGHDQRVRGMIQRGELTPPIKAAIKEGLLTVDGRSVRHGKADLKPNAKLLAA